MPKNVVDEHFYVSQCFGYRKMLGKKIGRISRFSVKLFCFTVPNHFLEKLFCVSENFGYQKNLRLRGEYHEFLQKKWCIRVSKYLVGENLCVSQVFWFFLVTKKFLDKSVGGEGGIITAFCQKFLCQSAEKFRRGNFLCFRNILLSKNIKDKKGGGRRDFPSKLFCLKVLTHFVEEHLCNSESFGNRKLYVTKQIITIFHRFCLPVPKNFVGEHFCAAFQKNFR